MKVVELKLNRACLHGISSADGWLLIRFTLFYHWNMIKSCLVIMTLT